MSEHARQPAEATGRSGSEHRLSFKVRAPMSSIGNDIRQLDSHVNALPPSGNTREIREKMMKNTENNPSNRDRTSGLGMCALTHYSPTLFQLSYRRML